MQSAYPHPSHYPLSTTADLHATLVRHGGQSISLGQLLNRANALAQSLPASQFVINLCAAPHLFMLGFVTALLRGQTTLLPPNRLPHTIHQLRQHHPDCQVLVDNASDQLALQQDGVLHRLLSEQDLSGATQPVGPMPLIPASHLAAVLYTSGSTGEPQAIHKPWHTLIKGTAANARALLGGAVHPALLGTVPCQHSYGFEYLIMLSLQGYASVAGERPFYPQDIASALQLLPAPRVLVTTPVHLRTLSEAAVQLPTLHAIWSATAPLSRELAARAEQQFHAPLNEVFGCSEVGTFATRRTTQSNIWQLLPEFTLMPHAVDGRLQLHAEHVEQPCPLQDQIEFIDARHFRLLGRGADLINIAGKRASLADLNHQLLSIEGVVDGVLFLPDASTPEGSATHRTAALVVAPTLSRDQVLAALREKIDLAFMPRPLFMVTALPRNEVSKLPRDALLKLFAELNRG